MITKRCDRVQVFLRSEMADKLNLLVDLRRKGAARVIQQWIRHTRRLALVRQVIQVCGAPRQGSVAFGDLMGISVLMSRLMARGLELGAWSLGRLVEVELLSSAGRRNEASRSIPRENRENGLK